MSAPKLLDLFCCEGGASMGYHLAGFDVYGVDLFDKHSQSRYPFPSFKGDAILALVRLLAGERLAFNNGESFDIFDFVAKAASPPCQAYSITKHSHNKEHPDLLNAVRWLLRQSGSPYIIENVPGAPMDSPVTLCGAAFGLTAVDGDGTALVLKRHRLFESNIFLAPIECACSIYKDRGYQVGGVYGGGSADRTHAREVRRGGYTPAREVRAGLIGADWMTLAGLSQAIPPAYTQYLGEQLIEHLARAAA